MEMVRDKQSEGRESLFAFKAPDLSTFDATEEERRIAERFTRIRRVVIGGDDEEYEDAHTAWLVVENQQFTIEMMGKCGDVMESAEHASWFCWMLAKALIRVQRDARGAEITTVR